MKLETLTKYGPLLRQLQEGSLLFNDATGLASKVRVDRVAEVTKTFALARGALLGVEYDDNTRLLTNPADERANQPGFMTFQQVFEPLIVKVSSMEMPTIDEILVGLAGGKSSLTDLADLVGYVLGDNDTLDPKVVVGMCKECYQSKE